MRMEGFQGAVLGVKLRHLDAWNEKRRAAATLYAKALSNTPLITPAHEADGTYHVHHVYVCRAPQRDRLRAHLTEQGIGTGIHYLIPTHKQPLWLERFGEHAPLPVSEKLAEEAISLPMFPEITSDEVDFVAEKIAEFYG